MNKNFDRDYLKNITTHFECNYLTTLYHILNNSVIPLKNLNINSNIVLPCMKFYHV